VTKQQVKLHHEVIKRLALEYQATRNPIYYHQIVKRVDYLLLQYIKRLPRQYKFLRKIPLQDRYHAAIIGVHEAITTTTAEEEPYRIIDRILAYVKAALRRDFGRFYRLKESPEEPCELCDEDLWDFHFVDISLDLQEVIRVVKELYLDKLLTLEQIRVFSQRILYDQSYAKISAKTGLSSGKIKSLVEDMLVKVRSRLF